MGNKKAALFVGGFIFFLVPFSGVRDFGEPPMGHVVRGYECQDDGNKGDYDEIENHGANGLQAAYRYKRCQSQFQISSREQH
jgi:hypothetical protein